MDEAVKTLLLTVLLLATAGAHAQELRDPTRPPEALLRAGTGAEAAPSGPQLQSILIARQAGGRHVVVIDGRTLRLGDKINGAVIAKVTPTQVVLDYGAKKQVLSLAPTPAARQDDNPR